MTIQRILVGIDGSDGAGQALSWAADLARALGAELLVVHARAPISSLRFGVAASIGGLAAATAAAGAGVSDEAREQERAVVEEWCARVGTAIAPRRVLIDEGEAAVVIEDAATDQKADLIVVGRRGRGGFAELVLGSVSHHLTHHAHHPVVVVPPDSVRVNRPSPESDRA